jgi:two-component sensor histidine kinase
LREALTNVGKYAEGATKVEVTCKQEYGKNVIRIVHNGKGIDIHNKDKIKIKKGWGTKQAEKLAKSLKAKYKLYTDKVSGQTICELIWSIKRPSLWQQTDVHWRYKLHKYVKYIISWVNNFK